MEPKNNRMHLFLLIGLLLFQIFLYSDIKQLKQDNQDLKNQVAQLQQTVELDGNRIQSTVNKVSDIIKQQFETVSKVGFL